MSPREVEANGFVIGFKLVGSEGGTGFFKYVKGFPSCFDFVIGFPVDQELVRSEEHTSELQSLV